MLKSLAIDNYVLVDHLDVSFPGGLVIITGETGAGKSILIGAISLLLGARADVAVLRDKSRNCVIEAVEEEDGNEHYIRRVIAPSGRSRAFFDDQPVSLEELRDTFSGQIDIHSQNQQLLLADRKFRLGIIDGFAGTEKDLSRYCALFEEWQEAKRSLAGLKERIELFERQREYMEFQYEKLSSANICKGEIAALEAEQRQLANSESIRENIDRICGIYESSREESVDSILKNMTASARKVAPLIEEFSNLASRLESVRIELKDIVGDVSGMGEKLVFSPERLSEVDKRLALLYDLLRKHGVQGEEELITLREELRLKIEAHLDGDLECERLEKKCASLERECHEAAEALHDKRLAAAPGLSSLLEESIRSLEMPQAVFSVAITNKNDLGRDGADDVAFLFNANGRELQDLAKCASGGEFSRIMLCLKSVLSGFSGLKTVIFDEIDTGVSGSIADKMGKMIVEMGSNIQVFAITHLPQVASKGNAHYKVFKQTVDGEARSGIRLVEGDQRVREIARLLSGEKLSDEAIANAEFLLKEN